MPLRDPRWTGVGCEFERRLRSDPTPKQDRGRRVRDRSRATLIFRHPTTHLLRVTEGWQSGINFAEISDVGMRRANNQDSCACLPARSQERFEDRGHLFVVADGMGAHAAGELASRLATERIALHYFRQLPDPPHEALERAIIETNSEIHARGQENPEFHNMGTTASALAITPAGVIVGHVGDSRAYRLRKGVFEQLTFDHSLVWEMQASGQVGMEGIGGIPKNVITRSLGPNAVVNVDLEGPLAMAPGDRYLVCSDGLTGQVADEEIGTLLDCLPIDEVVRVLVDLANLRGGPDNITVIAVETDDKLPAPSTPRPRARERISTAALLGLASGACFLVAILFAVLGIVGSMVVALLLGIIDGIFSVASIVKGTGSDANQPHRTSGGAGPYRRFQSDPSRELFDRLGETVDALRQAAELNHWMMDWDRVDSLQTAGQAALQQKDGKAAIRRQSEAIIETMNQLREQNDRAAGETAIDPDSNAPDDH